jgi:peptidoglycan/xylan/chitin deacetylase (PgdA/CDA1 family)
MLNGNGFRPMTIEQGLARLASGESGHWVAFSFDDGYEDNVSIGLPILREAGAAATFFLTAGLIEQRVAPWWDQVAAALVSTRKRAFEWPPVAGAREIALDSETARDRALRTVLPTLRLASDAQRERIAELRRRLDVEEQAPCELATWATCRELQEHGMEVGAHTLTHPFLSLLPAETQREEIAGSVELIALRLGVRCGGLAYPGGDHDATTIEAASAAGLAYAVTTRAGDNDPHSPRHALRRRGLSEGACLGPGGRFSARLAMAELRGAFDGMRQVEGAS